MSDVKPETRSRADVLRALREKHAASVQRAQDLFREQRRMQQSICELLGDTPKTVPQIAAEIGKPSHEVLWFLAALKKYGVVIEVGMCGDYPLYQRAKEKRE
jgi:predicted Rossmann fold nucleotide-binding protein DprA/Smf involved in DNA uptake